MSGSSEGTLVRWLSARESSALVQKETASKDGTLRWVCQGREEAYRDVRVRVEAQPDPQPSVGQGVVEAAELALREIDGMFKFFLVSGLSEEGGGLPLYEQSKGLAEARAQLAAALATKGEQP